MSNAAAIDQPAARILFRVGPLNVTAKRLTRAIVVIAVLGALSFLWSQLDIEDLHARAKSLPGVGVIIAIALLPLVGFPVSWLHLIAGVRFDFWGGVLVVAFASIFHHLLGWTLVQILPKRFFARLEPWRKRLHGAGHRDAAVLCCLLPGMPYAVTLYLLPVIGVPLRLLLCLSAVLHTVRAVVTILFGDLSDNLTPLRIAALVGYYAVLFTASALALRGLRRSLAMNNTTSTQPDPAHITDRARSLWQIAGAPANRDLDFWLQAEAELKKESAQVAEQAPEHPAEDSTPKAPKPATAKAKTRRAK